MPTRRQWARWEKVGLAPRLGLTDLVFDWTGRRVRDLEVLGAITGMTLERTIEGASTLTIVVRDPRGELFDQWARRTIPRQRGAKQRLRPVEVDEGWEPLVRPAAPGLASRTWAPDVVGQAMQVKLDGAAFRLVGVAYQHQAQEITLTFEDRIVYLLRRKRGERRANRAKVTRAQFVLSLLREVKSVRPPFVCPELLTKQAIDKGDTGSSSGRTLAKRSNPKGDSASDRTASEIPPVLSRRYPTHQEGTPGARLSERQVRAAAELAGLSPTDALHAAQIAHGESDFYPGVIQNDPGDGMIGHGLWQMTPNAWGGPSSPNWKHMTSLGGLQAMYSPLQNARQMAWMFKGSGNSWRQWYGTRYLDLSSTASGSVLAEGVETDVADTAEGKAAERGGGSYSKAYQFTREPGEDSWTAIQRLAEEVGWRCFVVGEAVYYMSERQLFGRRPRYEISSSHPAVIDLRYDVDWGKPVSEATLTVALDRWGAPPGAVILISGFGPPDGRWLITGVRRDWFSPTAEVTLKQPGKAKLEPAPERVERASTATSEGGVAATAGTGDDTAVGRAYAEAEAIHTRNLSYIWGGGHARCGTPDSGTNTPSKNSGPPPGFDCSGYTCAQLAAGGMGFRPGGPAAASGALASWGEAGPGERMTVWANGGHVFVEYHGFPANYADTSTQAGGGRGPHLRSGTRSTAGFTPRHWPGS